MMCHLDACLTFFWYFTLEAQKCDFLSQLLTSVMSSLTLREHIESRVVYEIIFLGQMSRADADNRGTREEISDKCVYYQIKVLNAKDQLQWASSLTLLTLILLTWRIGWATNNASRWQMGFNLAFKGLIPADNA